MCGGVCTEVREVGNDALGRRLGRAVSSETVTSPKRRPTQPDLVQVEVVVASLCHRGVRLRLAIRRPPTRPRRSLPEEVSTIAVSATATAPGWSRRHDFDRRRRCIDAGRSSYRPVSCSKRCFHSAFKRSACRSVRRLAASTTFAASGQSSTSSSSKILPQVRAR